MLTLYRLESWEHGYSWEKEKRRLTGRWKLVTDAYEYQQLYIEVKGWILTHWIKENDLDFFETIEYVNECGK